MSTGTTAGPYYLTYQVQQTFGDTQAQWGQTSDFVQVQNSSGFVLQITSGGDVWTIQPLTAATIPTQDGKGITVYPSSIGAQLVSATIYLVWLLPGQTPPMQDGPLSSPLSGFYNLNNFQYALPYSFTASGHGASPTILVTLPLVGNLPYVLVNFTITSFTGFWSMQVDGVSSGGIATTAATMTTTGTYTLLYAVQPSDTEIQIGVSWEGGGAVAGTINTAYGASMSQPIPADVVPYGGGLTASIVTSDTASHTLLPAPLSGFSYRIHSANLTSGGSGSFMKLSVSGFQPFCTIAQGTTGFVNLGGRIINGSLLVQNTASGSAGLEVGYDIIQTPLIN